MVQLSRSLLSWLAASQASSFGPSVLSCSDSTIAIAGGSLGVGEIFIRVDSEDPTKLCREECGILFREIVSDEGNGVYRTASATFSQVFPRETYDSSYQSIPVESILPSCSEKQERTEAKVARRYLEETERKHDTGSSSKDYEDDKYVDDKYVDDKYPVEKKRGCEQFYDATKKFIFDMYCIIRSLECTTDYDPTQDDVYADDDVYVDDDQGSVSKDKDHHRRLLETEASKPVRRMRGVKGLSPRLLEEPEPAAEGVAATTTTVTFQGEDHKDDKYSTGSTEDDAVDDDYADDFFDDDNYNDADDGANFWKILDAVFEYIASIKCIFKDCQKYPDDDVYKDDDYYDDKYTKGSKDSKDKHIRALVELQDPAQHNSLWSSLFGGTVEDRFEPVPTSFKGWMAMSDDGDCAYSKCNRVNSSEQCFQRQSLVADTCRDALEEWFALPAKGEDNVWSWNMDVACHGQDFCYASNIFGQTQCDDQFYHSLMESCPDNSVALSRQAPLVTDDLYEHCPLVSFLLYSKMRLAGDNLYEATKEGQSLFEASGCN